MAVCDLDGCGRPALSGGRCRFHGLGAVVVKPKPAAKKPAEKQAEKPVEKAGKKSGDGG